MQSGPGTISYAKCRLIIFKTTEPQPQKTSLAETVHWAQIWIAVFATLAALRKSYSWLAEKEFWGKMKHLWETAKNFAVPNPSLYINNFVPGSFSKAFLGVGFGPLRSAVVGVAPRLDHMDDRRRSIIP